MTVKLHSTEMMGVMNCIANIVVDFSVMKHGDPQRDIDKSYTGNLNIFLTDFF